MSDTQNLKLLGSNKTTYLDKPNKDILETFENQHQDILYLVPFICNEFTSVCPKTGQPDFAKFEIIYVPHERMIESKSLKLYLFSFRNQGEFHEDVTNRIFKDLFLVLKKPKFLRVIGDFTVRGGISIKPMVLKYGVKTPESREKIQFLIENWDRVKSNLQ